MHDENQALTTTPPMTRAHRRSSRLRPTGVTVAAPQAVRALATGALAVGTFALGAIAVGAVAVGALAIGRLAVGRGRIKSLEIDELSVRRLVITEELLVPQGAAGEPSSPPVPERAFSGDSSRQ